MEIIGFYMGKVTTRSEVSVYRTNNPKVSDPFPWATCSYFCFNLFQLAADPDQNVKNGTELLDRLIKVS